METVYDPHPELYGLEHDAALLSRQHAGSRRHSKDEVVRYGPEVCERRSQVTADGNPIWFSLEHCTGIEAGLLAIDDRLDGVLLGVTDEPVGRLAVNGTEIGFAIDNCGCGLILFTRGSWLNGHRRSVAGGMVMIGKGRVR